MCLVFVVRDDVRVPPVDGTVDQLVYSVQATVRRIDTRPGKDRLVYTSRTL